MEEKKKQEKRNTTYFRMHYRIEQSFSFATRRRRSTSSSIALDLIATNAFDGIYQF
jgi:hypothetical protein